MSKDKDATGTSMPKKIAILGGGVGAMTTAYSLVQSPDYDPATTEITVYQMGWRLGGKGASGRAVDDHDRIEEHGIHVWMGCYQNAFSMIQTCYEELVSLGLRKPSDPLGTWEKAFHKQNLVGLVEHIEGEWIPWVIDFPTNSGIPGGKHPTEFPTLWNYIQDIISFLHNYHENNEHLIDPHKAKGGGFFGLSNALHKMVSKVVDELGIAVETLGLDALESAAKVIAGLKEHPGHGSREHGLLIELLEIYLKVLWERVQEKINQNTTLRRIFELMDLGVTVVLGLLRAGITSQQQLEELDVYDFREWLAMNGAARITVQSALVRTLYDTAFAYLGGDTSRPNFAAGAYLTSGFRILLTYKGAIFYEMQAGMGDTIFAPIYQVLRARGVKFAFFHKVKNLGLSEDKRSISTVEIEVQATIKEDKDYEPLYDVKGLPCWPAKPFFEQLVEGETLRKDKIHLESNWAPWGGVGQKTLVAGEDFDTVVLGIPVGSLPFLCPELIAANATFAKMVKEIPTTQTQGVQLWIDETVSDLGWTHGQSIVATFWQPLNTWADFTHLIERESWPPGTVKSLAYYCGPLLNPPLMPPTSDVDFPPQQHQAVLEQAAALLPSAMLSLWPNASGTTAGGQTTFDWSLLVAPDETKGLARLARQFFRANIDPSERYVLSAQGTTAARLWPYQSGFANLLMAGDWTRTGFNAGNVEGAVMSGMTASRAICGHPKHIVGQLEE